jgi:hypothetical protein
MIVSQVGFQIPGRPAREPGEHLPHPSGGAANLGEQGSPRHRRDKQHRPCHTSRTAGGGSGKSNAISHTAVFLASQSADAADAELDNQRAVTHMAKRVLRHAEPAVRIKMASV